MDALMNTVAFQTMSLKADTLGQAYAARMEKEVINMEEQMAAKELEMLPQVPKGQYIDVYA
ncbi:MAG: hypothetical protein IKN96_01830 [Oscillibacter sp.]|nr:hypothetical protein [Oscillibacter sp.]